MAEKWIQKAIKKPGSLRATLGVKEGENIPAKKLAAAEAGKYGPKAEKRAHLARTLKSLEDGTGLVPETGNYRLHKGESVIPAGSNDHLGRSPIKASKAQDANVQSRSSLVDAGKKTKGNPC